MYTPSTSASPRLSGVRPRQPPAPIFGSIDRDQLAQRFFRVAQQLEALQSIAPHEPSPPSGDRTSPNAPLTSGHSCERVQEVLRHNMRFRPCESVARSASDNAATALVTSPPYPHEVNARAPKHCGARPVNASPRTVREARLSPPPVEKPTELYPAVGRKARTLPPTELSRMKQALKKRSYALANVPHTALTARVSAATSMEAPPLSAVTEENDSAKTGEQEDRSTSFSSPETSSSGKHALIAELVRLTEFSTAHIFQLSRRFKATAGATKCAINFEEFREVLGEGMSTLLLPTSSTLPDSAAAVRGHVEHDQDLELEDQQQAEVTSDQHHAPPDLVSIGATIAGSETFLQRLFHAFDADGNGQIDVREFIVGLNSLVRGTPEDKVAAIFEIYRSDAHSVNSLGDSVSETKGALQQPKAPIADLLGLFQSDRQRCQELTRCVDDYFVRVQLHDEAAMTTDEFVAASLAEPRLLRHVSRSVASERRRAAEDPWTRELLQRFVACARLRWQTLVRIQQRMKWPKTTKGAPSVIDVQRVILEELQQQAVEEKQQHMQTSLDEESSDLPMEELTQNLVAAYRTAAKEALSPPAHDRRTFGVSVGIGTAELEDAVSIMANSDLAKDLAGVLQTSSLAASAPDSAAHQARFFFEHFDADGDGHMTRHELAAGLGARVGAQVLDVARRLEDEDSDQDGELTPEEYLRAAYKSPLIFASLYTCL